MKTRNDMSEVIKCCDGSDPNDFDSGHDDVWAGPVCNGIKDKVSESDAKRLLELGLEFDVNA